MNPIKIALIRSTLSSKRIYWVLQHWQKWVAQGYSARYVCDSLQQLYQSSSEKYLLRDIDLALRNGRLMADGFSGWLPAHTVKWLANCERSQYFSQALQWIMVRIANKEKTWNQCVTKLSYALSIFTFSIFQLLVIVDDKLINILDSLIQLENRSMPLNIVIAVSTTLKQYNLGISIGLAAFITITIVGFKWLNSMSSNTSNWGSYLPFIALYRQYSSVEILSEAALLVQSGYNWKLALQICEADRKGIQALFCRRVLHQLAEGRSTATAIVESKLLSHELCLQLAGLVDGQIPADTVLVLSAEQLNALEALFIRKIIVIQGVFIVLTVMNMLVLISGLYSIR